MGIWDDFTAKLRPADLALSALAPGPAAGLAAKGMLDAAIPDQPDPNAPVSTPVVQRPVEVPTVTRDAAGLAGPPGPIGPPAPEAAPGMVAKPGIPAGGIGFGSLDKDVKAKQEKVFEDENKLIQDERGVTNAELQKSQEISGAYAGEAARQREALAEEAKIEQASQAKQQSWFDQSARVAEDLQSQKLDPNRLYGKADTGTKIGLVIGGALGGVLSAWQGGGRNQFVDHINGLIDRDIKSQEENYARGKDYLKNRDTLFGQMMQMSGDQRVARLQTRQGYIQAAQMQLQAQVQAANDPVTKANGEKNADQLQRMADQNKLELAKAAAQAARAQAAAAAAAQKAAQKEAFDQAERLAKLGLEGRKLDIEEGKAAKEGEKNMVVTQGANGLPATRQAISPEAAKSYQEYSKIAPEAKRLLDVMKRTENTVMGKAEYEAARAKLIEIMPTLYGYSRGPSVAQVGHTFGPESLPDWTTGLNPWSKRSSAKKLEDLEKTINTIDSSMQTATFAPAQMPASVQFEDKLRGK